MARKTTKLSLCLSQLLAPGRQGKNKETRTGSPPIPLSYTIELVTPSLATERNKL